MFLLSYIVQKNVGMSPGLIQVKKHGPYIVVIIREVLPMCTLNELSRISYSTHIEYNVKTTPTHSRRKAGQLAKKMMCVSNYSRRPFHFLELEMLEQEKSIQNDIHLIMNESLPNFIRGKISIQKRKGRNKKRGGPLSKSKQDNMPTMCNLCLQSLANDVKAN